MSDSKGAAIDNKVWEIINNARCPHHRCSKVSALNDQATHQILAILAQEVKKARIDEWKQLDIGVNISKDFPKRRITNLERLG